MHHQESVLQPFIVVLCVDFLPGRNSGKHRRGLGLSLSSPQFGVVVLAVNDCPAKVCCQRTCEVYQCSNGFAKNPEMKTNIGFLASKLKCILSIEQKLQENPHLFILLHYCDPACCKQVQ